MIVALLAAAEVLAVLEFRDEVPADQRINTAYLADQARATAKEMLPHLKVITRENMLVLLQASGKKLEECEGECEVDTGRRIGADLVVSGELIKFGTQYKLNMKLHDTRTGELISGAVAAGTTADELDRALRPAMEKLFAAVKSGAPPPVAGGLLGLQLHGGAGWSSQELTSDPGHAAGSGGAFTLEIGGDVTWHAASSVWVGPWLALAVTRQNYEASDFICFGGLVRFPAGTHLWLSGGLGYAAMRDGNGWSLIVQADAPIWSVLAAHAQILVAHGAVGIGLFSGDDALYSSTAGLSLVF